MNTSTSSPASMDVLDDARRVAAVLAPLRRRILESLVEPDSAAGLSRRLGIPRQKLNYHLRQLEKQGFLELDEERPRRGCVERRLRATSRVYLVNPALLGRLGPDPEAARDRFSSTYLIAAGARMVQDAIALRRRARRAKKKLPTLTMQMDIRFRTPERRAEFARELSETLARLAAKYHDDAPGGRLHRFLLGGHPVITKPSDPDEEEDPS